jgi:NitT/TauT family transport system permease protein
MRLVNRRPGRAARILLIATPFLLLMAAYVIGSSIRLAENPQDKLLPSIATMAQTMGKMAFSEDARTGDVLLWSDTIASLWRFGIAMGISVVAAFAFGIAIGFLPHANAAFAPFLAAFSLIPPIAVLPILFIVAGLDELSKILLIIIGVAPVMTRAVAQAAAEIPRELVVKAQTLGANTWQMILRLVAPQTLPRLLTATRLSLCPAWIFLISAEAIASTGGLGYRIFLVRRFLAMDIILPYVLWITLLAFIMDRLLVLAQNRLSPWHKQALAT